MKRVAMMLAVGMLLSTAAYGKTAPLPDADKSARAQAEEEKGDLARIHKNYAEAAADYMAALRYSPKNADLYNKAGIVELQMGQRGMARRFFAAAIKYNPQLISALNNLGAVNLLDKKYRPAVGYFKQALALDESSAPIHLNLAEAWMGLEETTRATTEYGRALELDADVLSSDQGGVVAQLQTPEQRARLYYMIAKSYMKRGNPDGALDYLGRAKDMHYADLSRVYSDPEFSALWKDPRLSRIIKR